MKLLRGVLALALSYALGVQPAVAQVVSIHNAAPAASAAGASAASITGVSAVGVSAIQPLTTLAPAALSASPGALAAPAAFAAPSISVQAAPAAAPAAAAVAAAPAPSRAIAAVPSAAALAPSSKSRAASTPERLVQIKTAADAAVVRLDRAGSDESSAKAGAQFSALVGERSASAASALAEAPSAALGSFSTTRAALDKPTDKAPSGSEKADVPAPQPEKTGWLTVFRDGARNKAFWRYVFGYSLFLMGFEMYVVGQPYLISSMVNNSLKEGHDQRANDAKQVQELVRSNRSLARIAHWTAQFFSYLSIPLFTRDQDTVGPKKWLVRSMLIRAAVLGAIPVLFFSTGVLGLQGAMWLLFGLMAAQSFFQGISVTAEGAATTRLLGDPSVTHDERTKANSILTVLGSVIAIIGPLIAGQIALIGPVHGKTGVGGAVIYGIYAGMIALTGLIYAGIKMFGGQSAAAKAAVAKGEEIKNAAAPKTLKTVVAELWGAIKDGLKIVFKDRLLRTMLLMSMVSSLFSDPLVFNVLPEYIEGLVAKNPGSVGAIMHVPGVGWFLKTLTATPMGNFALMMVMASIGSIVATLLMKPLTKLFQKLGFKTEEALTVPFYVLAALEAPLFLLMIHTPTMLGAVALYGLQSLVVGFIGIAIQGLYQKNLGGQKDENVNKILAADSLLGIGAAIVSTFAYGFLLKDIAIGTSLIIAAVATGVVALIRLAAPFLMFTKDQRRPPEGPKGPPSVPPAHAMPSTGDHNGPNSILSTHL